MHAVEALGFVVNPANVTHILPVAQRPDMPGKWALAIGVTGGSQLLELLFDSETEAKSIRSAIISAINSQ